MLDPTLATCSMTPFDWHKIAYPKTWSEMSFDFRLMFAWHGSMMGLMACGAAVPVMTALLLCAMLAASLAILSVRHRRSLGWHWPGVRARDVASAVFYAVAIGLFLYAGTPLFPPVNVPTLAWYLAGAVIGVFWVLMTLNVTRFAEADFLADCGRRGEPPRMVAPLASSEAPWRRAARTVFTVAFLLVWADGVAFFYFFGTAFRGGSPTRTAEKSERMEDHRTIVYVTVSEKRFVDALQTVMMSGIPGVLASAAVLHFVLGVKLFPNTPTLREVRSKRPS
jgi:hypothetical protein